MISLKCVPKVRINNIPALVQIMAWRRPGDKPLSEPMMLVYWLIYASLGLNELTNILVSKYGFSNMAFDGMIGQRHLLQIKIGYEFNGCNTYNKFTWFVSAQCLFVAC